MQIWLDPALYRHSGIAPRFFTANDRYVAEGSHSENVLNTPVHYAGDCGDCDDCASPQQQCIVAPPPLQERITSIWDHRLCCSQDLYLAPLDTTHWLACNPITEGNIVVLDEEARSLLELFRSEQRLKDLMKLWANVAEYDLDQPSARQNTHIVALFVALGLIIDKDKEVDLSVSSSAPSKTLSAWLHVTNACNMGCSYCYIPKSQEHMAADVGERAVDAVIRSALRSGYQQIHLKYAGGEALLRFPHVLALHDYAVRQTERHGLRLSTTLLSNGAALLPRSIEQLKQRNIRVMISLDGIGEDHDKQRPLVNGMGSFRLVDRAIARLLAYDLIPNINVTVSQHNLAGLPKLVDYLLEHELPFSFSYYRENDCSASLTDLQFTEKQMIHAMKAAFAVIERQLPARRIYSGLIDKASFNAPHHHTCNVGESYLVIDQHGGVARCQTEITHTLTTIAADDPLQDIRNHRAGMQVLDVDQKEGCRTCNWRYWCTGGCAAVTYRLTGRNDIRSPNCGIYKALFPEALRLEALRLLKYAPSLTFHS